MKQRKRKLKRSIIKKFFIFLIFTVILCFLFYMTYYIYMEMRAISKYNKKVQEYSYLEIEKMSDKFAEIENKEFHFVRDKYNVIYIISIDNNKLDKYENMIEYTYGKREKVDSIKLYGLPVRVSQELKQLIINNINKFLSFNEQMDITVENYEEYLPITFLDTTIKEQYKFNYVVFLLFLIFSILFLLLIKLLFFKKLDEKSSV